jgi:hypothetical protein
MRRPYLGYACILLQPLLVFDTFVQFLRFLFAIVATMNDVLIVKNISREGPGLLERILVEAGLTATVVDLDKGESFPSPLGYKALVVLGGPDSANDTTDKMLKGDSIFGNLPGFTDRR